MDRCHPSARFAEDHVGSARSRAGSLGERRRVAVGEAILEIPEGAYPAGGKVSATWLRPNQVLSASGRALFADDEGAFHRLLGQLHVEASEAPAVPVTLRVPLAASMTGEDSVVLQAIQDGEPAETIEPVRVADGVATFELKHFSVWSVMRRRVVQSAQQGSSPWVIAGWMLIDAGTAIVRSLGETFGQGAPEIPRGGLIEPGTDLPSGTELDGSGIVVGAPNGAVLTLDGPVRIETDPDLAAGLTCLEHCKWVDGEVPPRPAPAPRKLKLWIRTQSQTVAGGVRGTVFRFSQTACSVSEVERDQHHGGFRRGSRFLGIRWGVRRCPRASRQKDAKVVAIRRVWTATATATRARRPVARASFARGWRRARLKLEPHG